MNINKIIIIPMVGARTHSRLNTSMCIFEDYSTETYK